VDGMQGVVQGSLHTLRCLSGPAAALATGGWLWGMVSPHTHSLCAALVALLAVSAEYNSLGRDIAQGRLAPGECGWLATALLFAEFPAQPPVLTLHISCNNCCCRQGDRGRVARSPQGSSAAPGGLLRRPPCPPAAGAPRAACELLQHSSRPRSRRPGPERAAARLWRAAGPAWQAPAAAADRKRAAAQRRCRQGRARGSRPQQVAAAGAVHWQQQ
jgi:hypothetical protein